MSDKITRLLADMRRWQSEWQLEDTHVIPEAIETIERLRSQLVNVRREAIEQCAAIAEGFDAACDSPRMKLFVEAGLVMAIYKRDGEIGAAIRKLAQIDDQGK